MTLIDAEILALVVPVAGAAMAFIAASVTRSSVLRRRRRIQSEGVSRNFRHASEELVEINPEALLSMQSDEKQRFYMRATSLRALAARVDS